MKIFFWMAVLKQPYVVDKHIQFVKFFIDD